MLFGKAAVLAVICLAAAGVHGPRFAESSEFKARVGQVDMEKVYRGYHGTLEFQAEVREIQRKFQEAQEAGEHEKLMELQRGFQEKQEAFHRKFESRMTRATAEMGDEAGVDMIVAEVIFKSDDIEVVDVSGDLVSRMNEDAPEPESLHEVLPAP